MSVPKLQIYVNVKFLLFRYKESTRWISPPYHSSSTYPSMEHDIFFLYCNIRSVFYLGSINQSDGFSHQYPSSLPYLSLPYLSTQVERYGPCTTAYSYFTAHKRTVYGRNIGRRNTASYMVTYYCAQVYEKIRSIYGAVWSKFTVKIRIAVLIDLGYVLFIVHRKTHSKRVFFSFQPGNL